MPADEIDNSPLTMTRTWEEVFGRLDQWDVVDKLRALHLKASTSTSSTGFLQFKSPDIAHLMANTSRRVRLFHHFHHDADDGLNDGTDELWALMGSGAMATAMSVNKNHVNESQRGTTFDWSKMLAWNSTRDVGDTIAEFAKSRTRVSGRSRDVSPQPAPAKRTARANSKATTATKTKKTAPPKGRLKTTDDTEDDDDEVTVAGFTMTNTVPVPGFLAVAFMETYETNPLELCWLAVDAIKNRAAAEPDKRKATRLAEAAAYVPRWLLSVAINILCDPDPDFYGVGTAPPYCRRSADWTRTTHEKFLAVKSRSLLKTDEQPSTPGRSEDVFRNLSTILERQATVATTPPPAKSGFDSFPPATKKMILFISERGADGERPSAPVSSFAELLSLSNVAYVQNHIHNFLRNAKGRDALIPMGLCAAIRTASFIADVSDRPGAFSLFCCGPQVLDRSTAGSRESYDYTNNLVQMQLKTTDTTTGFSDKDIKTMTKLSFTAPRDFHELARLVENMAGITEILFGRRSPLTDMLYEWRHFLTLSVGSTLATLRQLAHTDGTAACRLGWFIDRRTQQYLVLCAGVEHEEEINPSLLDFSTVRQQLEDGAFVFPACDFLRDKLGRGTESKPGATTVTPSGSTSRTNRRAPPADEVINSQKDVFPKDPNDNWQVYLDHVRTGPIPNMCCRWHLNGKCRSNCFLRDSHVALTTEQVAGVTEWIKQCRARMRRPTQNERTGKKQKLGTSESAYSRSSFVAAPSKWKVPSIETPAGSSNRTGQAARPSPRTHTSRQDDPPFHKRRSLADDSSVRPHANPTRVRWSPTYRQPLADAPPFRPIVAPSTIGRRSTPPRHEFAKVTFASPVTRTETHTPGTEQQMPAPGDDSNMPTSRSAAAALHPPPPGGRGIDEVPTRHTTSPPRATDARADATPTSGKSHTHVPLPTIPLPFVDSPFPPLPEGRLADALASILGASQPTTRPTIGRRSTPPRHEFAKVTFASPVTRTETHTPGTEQQMPAPGDDSNMPTSRSAAAALHPPPPGGRGIDEVPTRHTTSPPRATDARADATPTSGKSHTHVPLPTIPLPFVDSPFPPLPEGRLADALASILGASQPTTGPTDFRFEWSSAAADHNLAVLRKHALDLDAALAAQPFSSITPGSEFRPAELLAPLLSLHPLWPKFQERISNGAEFPLRDIADADRIADVTANLARGNHKSAQGHEAKLIDMLKEEVERGWQLPLPISAALMIKGCEVAPLGMVAQTTIDEKGNAKSKFRLTHDQSFNPSRNERRSVNNRVDASQLTVARFGKAFSRLIYHISYLRQLYPNERILMTKVDWKSAYRRIHLKPSTAVRSCTSIDGLLLMALRMTFGGSPNPAQWSDVSEVVTDLANDLVRRNDWDPQRFKSPHQARLLSDDAVDNDRGEIRPGEAFAETEYFAVDEPEDDLARFDCYLDDIFGAFMEREAEKSAAAIPLALHIVGRPHDPNGRESFPRDDILAIPKFLAEAKPSERKMILGWIVDTRKLSVALPQDKFKSWTRSVDDILRRHKSPAPAKDLETLMGRLNHASYVIPYARHFTGRLYKACERARRNGSARLTRMQLEDLELWRKFLRKAANGISINKLVCRWPTRIVRVDACPQGMGGYCLESGIAWRYLLPESLLGRATLNLLEFLAAFVGLLVEHGAGRKWSNADVMLSQGDSKSAAGWLAKSTFDDDCPMHLAMARQFADFCLTNDIVHYTQWFPGKKNSVADVLSRDFALNDEEVTKLIRDNCSPFVPQHFRIIPLQPTIISRIGDLLRRLPKTQLLPAQPAPSAIAAGAVSSASSVASDNSSTLFSDDSDEPNKSKSSRVSRPPFGEKGWVPDNVRDLAMDESPVLFVPPSTVWLRPSGFTNLRAPSTTQQAGSNQFWHCN